VKVCKVRPKRGEFYRGRRVNYILIREVNKWSSKRRESNRIKGDIYRSVVVFVFHVVVIMRVDILGNMEECLR
jgi:hypothetical protein